ncbi:glycoside hydrolase superfamily [Hyaloraphidium curvatum]|nr:glycoside hydrolase superfamily [Hyaloraphidium curvatum]
MAILRLLAALCAAALLPPLHFADANGRDAVRAAGLRGVLGAAAEDAPRTGALPLQDSDAAARRAAPQHNEHALNARQLAAKRTTRPPRPRPARTSRGRVERRTSTRTATRTATRTTSTNTRTATRTTAAPPPPPPPPISNANPKFHFGVAVQFDRDTPAAYVQRVGFVPTVWTTYERIGASFNVGNPAGLGWMLSQLGQPRGSLTIVMQLLSDCGIGCVTDVSIRGMAEAVRRINGYGVKVIIVPYPECNGYWFSYGNQPGAMVASFRRIVDVTRAFGVDRNMVRFGWHVMETTSYPWGPTRFDPLLDTNRNGRLDRGDDPWSPYYPGDSYVDWIGMSAYHYGVAWPWGENELPPAGKLRGQIRNSQGEGGSPNGSGFDLYRFASERGKRFAVFETAGTFYPASRPGPGKLAVMRAWWRQTYESVLFAEMPNLGMVVWFEYIKWEEGAERDFRATFGGMAGEMRRDLDMTIVARPGELDI